MNKMDFQQFFLLLILTVVSGQKLNLNPPGPRLYLVNGTNKVLTCSDDMGAKVVWIKPGNASANMNSNDNGMSTTMEFSPFVYGDSGDYTCNLIKNDQVADSAKITVIGVQETKTQPNYVFDKPLEPLFCYFNFSHPVQNHKFAWYQGDKKISSLNDARFEESSESLTITDPKRTDAGVYTVNHTVTDKIDGKTYNFTCETMLTADPFVLPFEKSKNLIQEKTLELQCKVLGYPKSVVTWYKDGVKLNETRAVMTTLDGHENARLVIENVDFPDAGDYNCTAHSPKLTPSDSKVIVVRVKDKLAALWPFLGIVAEVFVLCLIIFIYEKRRNKQAQQAENDAQVNNQTEPKGGVRNRKNQS